MEAIFKNVCPDSRDDLEFYYADIFYGLKPPYTSLPRSGVYFTFLEITLGSGLKLEFFPFIRLSERAYSEGYIRHNERICRELTEERDINTVFLDLERSSRNAKTINEVAEFSKQGFISDADLSGFPEMINLDGLTLQVLSGMIHEVIGSMGGVGIKNKLIKEEKTPTSDPFVMCEITLSDASGFMDGLIFKLYPSFVTNGRSQQIHEGCIKYEGRCHLVKTTQSVIEFFREQTEISKQKLRGFNTAARV